jgi:hypothetical protein
MDLCLRYGAVTLGIELKVWRDGEPDPLTEGLEQLDGYLAGLGLDGGWLIDFRPALGTAADPRAHRPAPRGPVPRVGASPWCAGNDPAQRSCYASSMKVKSS